MLMSSFSAAMPEVYARGTVACAKCGSAITLRQITALAEEFTLLCPRCHHRGFYDKRALAIEAMPERRKRARG